MRLDALIIFLLNDDTKYPFRRVNHRSAEAKKARPKNMFFEEWLETISKDTP